MPRRDTNGVQDVFLRNRATSTTTLVSLTHTGALANGLSGSGYISSDGKLVAFQSDATNLVPADTNSQRDIFLVGI
jgi:Tol biopolymer transport system component